MAKWNTMRAPKETRSNLRAYSAQNNADDKPSEPAAPLATAERAMAYRAWFAGVTVFHGMRRCKRPNVVGA